VSSDATRQDVTATLAAAAIPESKLGPARRARLDDAALELYLWILREFATRGRPGRVQLREEAERRGADVDSVLGSLAREDLVHVGRDGEIAVAYPFSGRPTAHRVRFRTGHEVDAMCAIDALGIAPMFGEPIEVTSRDPVTGEEISLRLEPAGEAAWQPQSAVVVAGAVPGAQDACSGCCDVLNFFASSESAERWLAGWADVTGRLISVPTAIAAGRAVFGDVLDRA
jgi:hypothetical protein